MLRNCEDCEAAVPCLRAEDAGIVAVDDSDALRFIQCRRKAPRLLAAKNHSLPYFPIMLGESLGCCEFIERKT